MIYLIQESYFLLCIFTFTLNFHFPLDRSVNHIWRSSMKIKKSSFAAIIAATGITMTVQADIVSSDNQILVLPSNKNIITLSQQESWQQRFMNTLKQYNQDINLSAENYSSEPDDIPIVENDIAKKIWEHGVEKAYVVNISSITEKSFPGFCQLRADIDIKGYKTQQKKPELINKHFIRVTQARCEWAQDKLEKQAEIYAARTLQQWQKGITTPVKNTVYIPNGNLRIPYRETHISVSDHVVSNNTQDVSNNYDDVDFIDLKNPYFNPDYFTNRFYFQYANKGSRFDNGFD